MRSVWVEGIEWDMYRLMTSSIISIASVSLSTEQIREYVDDRQEGGTENGLALIFKKRCSSLLVRLALVKEAHVGRK